MLFDVQDENGRSACSKALASISAYMEWESCCALLMRCFWEMETNSQSQQILLWSFCSILSQFHFSQLCSSQEADDPLANALGAYPDSTSSSGILCKCTNSEMVGKIKKCLHKAMLLKLEKLLNAKFVASVDISRAVLKLLKLLPGDIMHSQFPRIIHRISNFLNSHSDAI